MKKIISFIILLCNTLIFSQEKEVVFKVLTENNTVIFQGINNSELDQEVTLTLDSIKGLSGYSQPLKKLIPAHQNLNFTELKIIGDYFYKYSFNYNAKPTENQIKERQNKLISSVLNEEHNFNKGIVIFSTKGCSRCKMTVDYLDRNDIKYKYIDTYRNNVNNSLMWTTMKLNNQKARRITYPVILVNGNLHYSIDNLKSFLKSLKKEFKNSSY